MLAAQDPNFNDIDDPLNGQYELFTVDDLLIMRPKPLNNNTASQVKNYNMDGTDRLEVSYRADSATESAPRPLRQ